MRMHASTHTDREVPSRNAQTRLAAIAAIAIAAPTYAIDRTWNAGAGDWATQTNWSPVGWPAVTDHVFIGNTPIAIDAIANMDVGGTVAALDVNGRARLQTLGNRLRVNGLARIAGNGANGDRNDYARLLVSNGANAVDFEADSLQILSESGLVLEGSPTVTIHGNTTIAADAYIVGNGVINSAGFLSNSGEISAVTSDLTINVTNGAVVDLDGTSDGLIRVGAAGLSDAGVDLTINAAGVSDAFDGRLFLAGDSVLTLVAAGGWAVGSQGSLEVAWSSTAGYLSRIAGSPVTFGGELLIRGTDNTLRVDALSTFTPTALVHFNQDGTSRLELNNDSTVAGGVFAVRRDAAVYFNDATIVEAGAFELGQDADLRFNGPTTISGGSFATFNTLLGDGAVRFNGPTTWSGTVDIDGIARQSGDATISGATVINAGVFDMDVTPNVWNIQQGLTINAGAVGVGSNGVSGEVNVTGGTAARLTINLDGPGETWTSTGALNLGPMAGGAHLPVVRIAGSPVAVAGAVNVETGRPRISAAAAIQNSAVINVDAAAAELRLDAASTIAAGATFEGSGSLVCGPSGVMTIASGANTAGVGLHNQGTLAIGSQAGIASVDRFSTTGAWQVQIGGYTAGTEHDRLMVANGASTLGGQIQVRLIDSGAGLFQPQVGDEFTILTSLDAVSGTFAEHPRTYSHGQRFDWTVLYGSNDVTLRLDQILQCPPGDLDDDGDIDIADLAILLANFGVTSAATWWTGDINGDGDVDLPDLATLLANFGATCG